MRTFSLTLHVWRQKSANDAGRFVEYKTSSVNEHMSFLEMLDVLNERLLANGDRWEREIAQNIRLDAPYR